MIRVYFEPILIWHKKGIQKWNIILFSNETRPNDM